MCGIAGTFQIEDGKSIADLMGESLSHRGPDENGLYSFADDRVSAHLAHRRLSIIDLSHGQQPLVKGGLALSYNGELYNYRALRAELISCGVAFCTNSDTEVVLEAWREWGPDCLTRFRGMFAFAIVDEASGSLYLARDQLGIKPLHYLVRHGGVAFSSELKGLLAAFGPELRIDASTLVASILYYWVPDGRCSIDGVQKLQPGTWAEFRPDGTRRIERYWDPAGVAAAASHQPRPDLRQVIEESVTAHLVSDVPVSSFLSGGLDSSIVTVLAKQAHSNIDAYTVTFRPEDHRLEAMPDDAVYARQVARRFGIDLHEIQISPNVVELLPQMVRILDEPVGDPAAINTLLMCQAARDVGVKVILSGMGADELFAGYRKHLACMISSRYRHLPGPVRAVARGVVGGLPVSVRGRGLRYARWAKRFLTFSDLPEEAAFRRSYSLFDAPELSALVDPDLAVAVDDVMNEHRELYLDNELGDVVYRMCLTDSRYFLPGLNLMYTDRASMAASTEVRVPFVDPEVFRAAFSFSGHEKIKGRKSKVALKEAARAWLPENIISRPKSSFSAPLRAWIGNDLREVVDDVLVRGELVSCGFLQGRAVDRLVDEERRGIEDRSKQIWQLLTLELWYRETRRAGVTL